VSHWEHRLHLLVKLCLDVHFVLGMLVACHALCNLGNSNGTVIATIRIDPATAVSKAQIICFDRRVEVDPPHLLHGPYAAMHGPGS
jgi:hypothetical protein